MSYKPAKWESKFLEAYRDNGNVTESSRRCGISRNAVYNRRYKYSEFASRMDEAKEEAIESLEQVAWQRAKDTSDTLLIFLLKSLKPDQYRDQHRHQIEGRVEYALTFGDTTD